MKSLKESINSSKSPQPSDLENITDEDSIFYEPIDERYKDHKNTELLIQFREKANKLKIENENLKKLANHRITYSWWIFGFVVLFVLLSFMIIILSGLDVLKLNDNVLDVLLGTNMAQVVGVLYIVAKWLYPNN